MISVVLICILFCHCSLVYFLAEGPVIVAMDVSVSKALFCLAQEVFFFFFWGILLISVVHDLFLYLLLESLVSILLVYWQLVKVLVF